MPTALSALAASSLPPNPPSFDEVARTVEEIEGVRFRSIFARLPARAADGDAAIAAVWQLVDQTRQDQNARILIPQGTP